MSRLLTKRFKGDPCEAFAYHGYDGIESQVVRAIGTRIKAK